MPAYAENRKARHEYETLETFEAGLVLLGQEVKSIRQGGMKLGGSYVTVRNGEFWLVGTHVAPYAKAGNIQGYDPARDRKLLLHRTEIQSLRGKMEQKGLTFVPFSVYSQGHHVKLSFGLCRGRKAYDKREKLKKRDIDRETHRHLRGRDVE